VQEEGEGEVVVELWGVKAEEFDAEGRAAVDGKKNDSTASIETLRLALQRERGSFSNWSTEARPFARSPWFGSEVGATLKGLDRPVEL
jgi:hypothetical protein